MTPGPPALGNSRISAAPLVRAPVDSPDRQAKRRRRFTASSWLKLHSTLPRVRDCGNLVQAWCELKSDSQVSHFAGLASCASPWACPVCSAKIAAARVEEIAAATQAAIDDGKGVAFGTWTFSHHRGQSLAQLLDAQQLAWRLFTKSRPWRAAVRRFGLSIAPRVREQTYGDDNGWHPHIHGALISNRWLTERETLELEGILGQAWRDSLVSAGLSGSVAHAFKLDRWDHDQAGELAGYLTKQLALEVAGGVFKDGRQGRFSPMGILAAAMIGEAWAIARWAEYEQATQGKRSIFWPPKWAYRQGPELTDEELAEAEVGGFVVVAFDRKVHRALCALSPRAVRVLELDELGHEWAVAYVTEHAPPDGKVLIPQGDFGEGVVSL